MRKPERLTLQSGPVRLEPMTADHAAAREANPQARLTTTPMWQFPAVEGSYAPVIYNP